MHLPFSFSPCFAAIARRTIAVCRVSKCRLDSISVFHFEVNRIANEYLLRHWCCTHIYIYIFSCGSRKRMKILFRRYYRYFSSLSFFFLRKSLKFSLLRFYNKLVHHELLFSSNSNLVTVLIVHEMLRCKSVESFGRSQYTTFLLLIVEIAFDNQSREKIFVITITRPLFSNDVISQKFVSRMFQMLVII